MSSVGENIRRLRMAAGFKTQKDFAKELGVEQSRLSDWENSRYAVPDTSNLIKIAKTLRASLDELVRGFDAEYDAMRIGRGQPEQARRLTPEMMELLNEWENITPRARETLRSLLNDLAPKKTKQRRTA